MNDQDTMKEANLLEIHYEAKKDQSWWYCTNNIIFSLPYLFKAKPGQFYIILILTIKTV
jgi:hypothetical protein